MQHKFKIGDIIRRTGKDSYNIKTGDICEVKELLGLYMNKTAVMVFNLKNGITSRGWENRFELYQVTNWREKLK